MTNVGDKGTIRRGPHRGARAKVVHVLGDSIAAEVQNGEDTILVTVTESNFTKDPEPTIEVRAVREALEGLLLQIDATGDQSSGPGVLKELAGRLDIELYGDKQ